MAARFEVRLVREGSLVRRAKELRFRAIAEEMRVPLGPAELNGLDEDRFDTHCEHLVVRELATDRIAGTCRILPPGATRATGGYCVEQHFDLRSLEVLRDRMIEVGRACVHPDHRAASVMPLLWSAVARYLVDHGHDYVVGMFCMSAADGGHVAASVYRSVLEHRACPEDYRVFPIRPLPLERLCDTLAVEAPPMLRACINAGAWIPGEPALDRVAGAAKLPILLPLARMKDRYARQFLVSAA